MPLRPKLATLAAAACLALNVFVVPPAPAAQVNLPALGEAEADELQHRRRAQASATRSCGRSGPDPAVIDDPVLYEYLLSHLRAAARGGPRARQHQPRAGGEARVGAVPRARHRVQRVRAARRLHRREPGPDRRSRARATRWRRCSATSSRTSRSATSRAAWSANKHQSMVTMAAMMLGLLAAAQSQQRRRADGGDHRAARPRWPPASSRSRARWRREADTLRPGRDDRRRLLALRHGRHVRAPGRASAG